MKQNAASPPAEDDFPNLLRRSAVWAGLAVAVILIAAKLAAYMKTGSMVMLSALIDSSIDAIAALTTLVGVRSALRPADANHRYGHGKAEPLAALVQGGFVTGSAVLLAYQSLDRFINPARVADMGLGIGVMVFATVLTLLLVLFQHYVVKKTDSIAIGASRLQYSGDLGLNFAVIIALELERLTGAVYWDPLFALIIAAVLLYTATRIAIRSLHHLMDQELPDESRSEIVRIVQSHDKTRGVHDLRTRSDGTRIFLEMHLELDGKLTLNQSHDIADAIEQKLKEKFPNADILIHQEPRGIDDEKLDARIAAGR